MTVGPLAMPMADVLLLLSTAPIQTKSATSTPASVRSALPTHTAQMHQNLIVLLKTRVWNVRRPPNVTGTLIVPKHALVEHALLVLRHSMEDRPVAIVVVTLMPQFVCQQGLVEFVMMTRNVQFLPT